MKVYISADIEGIPGITAWSETLIHHGDFIPYSKQMTREVKAACEGAYEAGAEEIYVKDAHDTARNIDINQLPEYVVLHRGWTGDPMAMVTGLDSSFDAALFIGYHSGAASGGSPLDHTLNTKFEYIKINNSYASEFLIHAYAAALHEVPVVFVSADENQIKEVQELNPNICTLSEKKCIGKSTISIHPNIAIEETKIKVREILSSDFSDCKVTLPSEFNVEISYRKQEEAYRKSFYPDAYLISPKVIGYNTKDYYEVLRFLRFVS